MNRIPKNKKLSKIEKKQYKVCSGAQSCLESSYLFLPGKGEGDTMTDT